MFACSMSLTGFRPARYHRFRAQNTRCIRDDDPTGHKRIVRSSLSCMFGANPEALVGARQKYIECFVLWSAGQGGLLQYLIHYCSTYYKAVRVERGG
jgi:hypothetical protein